MLNLKELLLSALFPSHCLICGKPPEIKMQAQNVCDRCLDNTRTNETLFCIRCRARLADHKRICHTNTPLRLAAVGTYDDAPLKNLITRLKYKRHTSLVSSFSILINRYLEDLVFDFSEYIIIPIPLHPKRERERGFNQSLLIAEQLASQLSIPLVSGLLVKTKKTKAQAETKNVAERKDNLVGCFTVTRPDEIQDKKVLLVDDVCTSGATLTEAAETLKRAGAHNIIGFVIAKTG